MEIKLTKQAYNCLLNNVLSHDEYVMIKVIYFNKKYVCVDVSPENVDIIRDKSIEKQQQIGFDSEYDLTQEGRYIEEIIDAFYL